MLVTGVIKCTSLLLLALLGSVAAAANDSAMVSDHVGTHRGQNPTANAALGVTAQRQLLIQHLDQLEADNDRLRQQLGQIQSSDASVRSLEKVLAQHSKLIDSLRAAQQGGSAAAPSTTTNFQANHYPLPAAGKHPLQTIPLGTAQGLSSHNGAPVAPAAFWSLELAGASGVLALMGGLVLLFVITVLRKSYWMPRQCVVQRPAARVSDQGLAADLIQGYQNTAISGSAAMRDKESIERSETEGLETEGREDAALSDQAQAYRDQQAMARMLEQGLALSADDQALIGAECDGPFVANGVEVRGKVGSGSNTTTSHKFSERRAQTTATANAVAPRGPLKQEKNPLSAEYDLLGANNFDSDFSENDEFDELFEQAAKVPEGKPVPEPQLSETQCRRSDEDVLRSIREKTFGYVAPVEDDRAYIVEEGCDDLDKYMDITYIDTPVIELDEARERRGRSA